MYTQKDTQKSQNKISIEPLQAVRCYLKEHYGLHALGRRNPPISHAATCGLENGIWRDLSNAIVSVENTILDSVRVSTDKTVMK